MLHYQVGLLIHHPQALLEDQKKERFQVNIDFLVQDFKTLGKIVLILPKVGNLASDFFFRGQPQILHLLIRLVKEVLELFLRESDDGTFVAVKRARKVVLENLFPVLGNFFLGNFFKNYSEKN